MYRTLHTLSTIDIRRALLLVMSMVMGFTIVAAAVPAQALDVRDDDLEGVLYETTFYDLVPLGSCGAAADSAGVTLEGKDNIQKGFNYFVAKGLTQVQSAGIIGNLRQESGMNPKSKQLNGGPGRGLAQWTVDERWVNLLNYAEKKKADPWSLNLQLDFIWHEMTNVAPWKDTLPDLKKQTTIEGAVRSFEQGYEKAGKPVYTNRIKYAKETLAAFGGQAPVGTEDGSSENPSTDACGSAGIAVDGYAFPVAPQTKRSYSSMPCNNADIDGFGKNPNAGTVNYTTKFGQTTRITTCHRGDDSPAFDLMYSGVGGKAIYSITKGKVTKVNNRYLMKTTAWGKPCGSIMFKANNGDDKSYYWYGHILPGNVTVNKEIAAGVQMGKVATHEYGPNCYGGGEHLHIDRGCKDKNGTPQTGGNDNCRDPAFLTELQKIWEGLPASK